MRIVLNAKLLFYCKEVFFVFFKDFFSSFFHTLRNQTDMNEQIKKWNVLLRQNRTRGSAVLCILLWRMCPVGIKKVSIQMIAVWP